SCDSDNLPNEPCQFQHGGSLCGSLSFPCIVGHAIIAWRTFVESERLLFRFGQRRIADAAHSAANARRLKNLSSNDLANSFPVFMLTNDCVNMRDRGDSFTLHFE